MSQFNEKDQARFWENVERVHYEHCWNWQGGVSWGQSIEVRYQYGRFGANGKRYKAHRVAYILVKGEIPAKHVVRHKCDNPLCVNPHHLVTGTQYENDMDRTNRGRSRNGHTGRI